MGTRREILNFVCQGADSRAAIDLRKSVTPKELIFELLEAPLSSFDSVDLSAAHGVLRDCQDAKDFECCDFWGSALIRALECMLRPDDLFKLLHDEQVVEIVYASCSSSVASIRQLIAKQLYCLCRSSNLPLTPHDVDSILRFARVLIKDAEYDIFSNVMHAYCQILQARNVHLTTQDIEAITDVVSGNVDGIDKDTSCLRGVELVLEIGRACKECLDACKDAGLLDVMYRIYTQGDELLKVNFIQIMADEAEASCVLEDTFVFNKVLDDACKQLEDETLGPFVISHLAPRLRTKTLGASRAQAIVEAICSTIVVATSAGRGSHHSYASQEAPGENMLVASLGAFGFVLAYVQAPPQASACFWKILGSTSRQDLVLACMASVSTALDSQRAVEVVDVILAFDTLLKVAMDFPPGGAMRMALECLQRLLEFAPIQDLIRSEATLAPGQAPAEDSYISRLNHVIDKESFDANTCSGQRRLKLILQQVQSRA